MSVEFVFINAPILFSEENEKQDEEIRKILKKTYAKNDSAEMFLADVSGHRGFALANYYDENSDAIPHADKLFIAISNRNPGELNYDDLVNANDTAREMFEPEGGIYGVKFGNQLESIVARGLYPNTGYDYPFTIIERAVFYWYEIATHQCFFNGNKRTALLAALMTLEMNGYEVDLTSEEMYEISVKIANKELTQQNLYDLIFNKVSIIIITNQKQLEIYEEVKQDANDRT